LIPASKNHTERKDFLNQDGQWLRQANNPDPAKAHRPIIGLHLFRNTKLAGSKWSGRIYNADNGKTYASNVSLTSSKALKVEGCVLVFCGSETWTRLSGIETAMRDHEVSE
jgi:uncharacterized protein (DUF2147 family)